MIGQESVENTPGAGHRTHAERNRALSKAERQIIFRRAMAQGHTLTEASRLADITPRTGARWRDLLKSGALGVGNAIETIARKDEACGLLTAKMRDPEAKTGELVDTIERLSKLLDWDAAQKHQVTQISVSGSALALIEARYERDLAAIRAQQGLQSGSDNVRYVNSQAAEPKVLTDGAGSARGEDGHREAPQAAKIDSGEPAVKNLPENSEGSSK